MKTCFTIMLAILIISGYSQDPKNIKLEDLAFIAGSGHGEMWGGYIEEHWSKPTGTTMMGMFKYIKEGKDALYEFLLIEQTDEGPLMRLKHFNPGFIGWEEKDKMYVYRITSFKTNFVTFRNDDSKTSISFHRISPGQMNVTLEQERDGELKNSLFVYKSF